MKKLLIAITLPLIFIFPNQNALSAGSDTAITFVIDASGSMKGSKIENVKQTVQEIVKILRPEIEVGIVTFNTELNEILKPTTDRSLIPSALGAIEARGRTSLFDAIESTTLTPISGQQSRIVVLSDGGDTQSRTTYEGLLSLLESRSTPVDIIGLDVKEEVSNQLARIASTSSGNFYAIDDTQSLIEIYKTILKSSLIELDDANTVKIVEVSTNETLTKVFALSSALVVFLFLNFIRREYERKKISEARFFVLQKYAFRTSKSTLNRIRQVITSYGFIPNSVEKYMRENLELIHFKYRYETVVKFLLMIWISSLLLLTLLFNNIFVAFVLSFLIPPALFRTGVKNQFEKQKKAFDDELPEMLNVVASGLNAGLGLQQSLEAYAGDSLGEVSRQLRRAIGEIRVGTPTDEALMAVADRMKSEDLKWAVTALSIQRLVGGSMSTILRTTFETIKSRNEVRREVRTLAAEGKLSATVLMVMPIGIFFFLLFTRREYVEVFWTEPLGIFLVFMITAGMSLGWVWMKKIVDIKI
jgi:Flp pilus assembly protein TadB/uncharacterized protein YegL